MFKLTPPARHRLWPNFLVAVAVTAVHTLAGCDRADDPFGRLEISIVEREGGTRQVRELATEASRKEASGGDLRSTTPGQTTPDSPQTDRPPSTPAPLGVCCGRADGVAGGDDAPLAEHRRELLHLAFEIASRIPLHPHVKDRAKAQGAVVDAAIELDQPRLARAFAEPMPTWRRGNAFSDLAFHLAERGDTDEATKLLAIASAAMAKEEEAWRRDRIRAGIARTLALLGEQDDARRLSSGLDDAEIGRAEGARALRAEADQFDEHLDWVRQAAATGTIDLTSGALDVATGLFDRFYADSDRRRAAEEVIRSSWNPLPILLQVDLLARLAEIALEHDDQMKAMALVEETHHLIAAHTWVPEDHVVLGAKVAALRHRAGDQERGRAELDRLVIVYEEGLAQIGVVFRAGVLRSLAEALAAMGDADGGRAMYGRALDVALTNRNARPRAEDLSAIARSLALSGLERDDVLVLRLRDGRDGLTAPW